MEENLHSINAMRTMEVIEVNSGTKIGFIKDIKIDCEEHKILSIIIPGEAKGWFSKTEDIEVPWENIIKVGMDVLLVDFEGTSSDNIYG
ncbi:YlmC/YmxH family sporulation protein [Clostridium paraputrificum]|uniref:YlmC/YmxH family sporulation protein n=1 Tax=Clostridium TaxID=1485 RepID=UPI003D324CB2